MSIPTPKGGYSIDEFASRWGIVKQTVYNEISRGELRSIKIGKRRVITTKNEADWLAKKAAK